MFQYHPTIKPLLIGIVAICLFFLCLNLNAIPRSMQIKTIVGHTYVDNSQFNPAGLAVSPRGMLYVSLINTIKMYNPYTDEYSTIAGIVGSIDFTNSIDGVLATETSLNDVRSLFRAKDGEVYFVESGAFKIKKIKLNGSLETVAGTGKNGFSGDGGPAIDAKINPSFGDLFVSQDKEVYFSDYGNKRIRKIDKNGTISTVAGGGNEYQEGGLAINAKFDNVVGVTLNSKGEIVIGDTNNNIIRKVLLNGTMITIAGDGKPKHSGDGGLAIRAQVNHPTYLRCNANGDLFISDSTSKIRVILANGTIISMVQPETLPVYIAMGIDGSLFVSGSSKITKIDPYGGVVILNGRPNPYPPISTCVNECDATSIEFSSSIDSIDVERDTILITSGKKIYLYKDGILKMPNYNTSSISPSYAIWNGSDIILYDNGKIKRIGDDYSITTIAFTNENFNGDGGLAIYSKLIAPDFIAVHPNSLDIYIGKTQDGPVNGNTTLADITGLSFDPSGELLYLLEGSNLRKYSFSTNTLSTVQSNLLEPKKFTIAPNGDLFFLEKSVRISKISNSIVSVFGGTFQDLPNAYSGGDNGQISDAHFKSITSMTIALDGTMYLIDDYKIRKVNTNGIISHYAGTGVFNVYAPEGAAANTSSFFMPSLLTVSPLTNELYLVEYEKVIKKIDSNGLIRTVANGVKCLGGSGGDGYDVLTRACFSTIKGLTFLPNGELLVLDYVSHMDNVYSSRIRKIDLKGIITNLAGGYGNGNDARSSWLVQFSGMTMDSNGNLFIGDKTEIRKIDSSNIITSFAGGSVMLNVGANDVVAKESAVLRDMSDLYASPNGEFLISGYDIRKIDRNGLIRVVVDSDIGFPASVIMNDFGEIYISDNTLNSIKLSKNGSITVVAGSNDGVGGYSGDGGLAVKSLLTRPTRMRFWNNDVNGDIVFLDVFSKVIRKLYVGCPKHSHANPNNASDCVCDEKYFGETCSEFTCFGYPVGSELVCSGNGHCIDADICDCFDEYGGLECEAKREGSPFKCYGIYQNETEACSGKGQCVDLNICKCSYPYYGRRCENHLDLTYSCYGTNSTDSSVCSGHGQCISTDTCQCEYPYYGNNCENETIIINCNGIDAQDLKVCSGRGSCISNNTCICQERSSTIFNGKNCEIQTCKTNYYGKECENYCDSTIDCHSQGKCSYQIDSPVCNCFSNSTSGFWSSLTNCSTCSNDYYGNECLTKFTKQVRFRYNDGESLIMTIYAPYYISTLASINCSKLINMEMINLGNNPTCKWIDRENGQLLITLGSDHTIQVNSNISINVRAFEEGQSEFIQAIIQPPITLLKPLPIISTTMTQFGPCDQIIIEGSNEISRVTYQWSILNSPTNFDLSNLVTNTASLRLNGALNGDYSVQLIVKSYFNIKSDPIIFNFTKLESTIPQFEFASSEIRVPFNLIPIYISKYITFSGCSLNDTYDESKISFEWKQTKGSFTNFTILPNTDLNIDSFSNSTPQEYQFEATLHYSKSSISKTISIFTLEEEFDLIVFTTMLSSTNVTINVETSPQDKLSTIQGEVWSWNCLNDQGISCDQPLISFLNSQAISKSSNFILPSSLTNSKQIQLILTCGNRQSGKVSITFPEDEQTSPIISLFSVSPQKTILISSDILIIQFLVTIDGQYEDINSQITREWKLNNVALDNSLLLYSSDIVNSNRAVLDISKLEGGKSYSLTFTVTKGSKSTIYFYDFTGASNPAQCQCDFNPSTGYFLDTLFTITCSGCNQVNTVRSFKFLDFTTDLEVTLLKDSTVTQFATNLPYTGLSDKAILYVENKNTLSNAITTTSIEISLSLPIANTAIEVKKKKSIWDATYRTLSSSDPKKIVYGYISTTINAMMRKISSRRSLTSISPITTECNNGYFDRINNMCNCNSDFKGRDCSLSNLEWIEQSNAKWNDSKDVLDTIYSSNQYGLLNIGKLSYQTSLLYHILEDYDLINNQAYDFIWSIFKKQIDDINNLKYLNLPTKLSNVLKNNLQLFIQVRLSLSNGDSSVDYLNEINQISMKVSSIILRSEYSTTIKNNIQTSIQTKIYPIELSNLKLAYGDNSNETLQYPIRMSRYFVNTIDLRKLIYTSITKKLVESTVVVSETQLENNHTSKWIRPIGYELTSTLDDQYISLPENETLLSYTFKMVKLNSTFSKTTIEGNIVKEENVSSQIQCQNVGGICRIENIGNDYYKCFCSQSSRRISINEETIQTISYSTKDSSDPNVNNNDNNNNNSKNKNGPILEYLGFLAFIALIIIALIIVIIVVVICIVRRRKGGKPKEQNKKNVEMVDNV